MNNYEHNGEKEQEIYKCWRALGHEYINYLHDISLRLQIGKDPSEVISYIQELSTSIKEVRLLVNNCSILNTVKLQELLLRLISAGFRIAVGAENRKEQYEPKNMKLIANIVMLLVENSITIADDNRFIDIEITKDGNFKMCFPYAKKSTILNIFENQQQVKIDENKITQAISVII